MSDGITIALAGDTMLGRGGAAALREDPSRPFVSDELKDVIAMLGQEELSREDRQTVNRARRLERFLTQPFHVTEQFIGKPGKTVALRETLDGCERILSDEFWDWPERSLYMIGSVGEATREETAT